MEKRRNRTGRKGTDPEKKETEQDWLDEEEPEETEPEKTEAEASEEDDWLDEEEPEEAEEEVSEEDDWLDEEEPEEAEEEVSEEKASEEDDWLDEEEPEEAEAEASEEDDWLDEEEPEETEAEASEEDDWLDEEEPEETEEEVSEEDDWLDEEEPEETEAEASKEDDWLDEEEPEEEGSEEDALAGIVAAGMREESADSAPEASEDVPVSEEASADAPAPEEGPPPAGEEDLDWDGDWYDAEEDEGEDGEEEPSGEKKRHRRWWIVLLIIVAAIVAAYLYFGFFYRTHFEPNTYINGINCSYMTEKQVEDAIQDQIDEYELQIVERTGDVETLNAKDFDLHVENGSTLSDILEAQGPFAWPKAYFEESVYNPTRTMAWDEEELTAAIDSLNCTDENQMIDPEDAEIVYDEEEEKYVVEPAVYGTHIKPDSFDDVVEKAIASLADYVNLEETGCYETPSVTEESPEMIAACEQMNQMLSADITYDMIDVENIHITKDQIRSWISVGGDLEPTYDEEAIRSFIADIADQYNTVGREHTLQTSWGTTATVTNGTYGWELDQEGEYEQLVADLWAGETVMREPVWAHSAKSHRDPDYGDTYVEANLTRQHLYFYKGGTLIVDTDFVSGRMTTSRVTHEGIYYVYYKQSPAVLKGADYESPVTYWMPFNGGEGLHDATWRGSFGGTIYQYGGSHGCINLPYSAAEIIYNNISIGDCVFVYWEDGMTMSLVNDS